MAKIRRGTVGTFAVGLLVVWVLVLGVYSEEPSWTDAEKANARYVVLAFKEMQQANRVSNSEPGSSIVSTEDWGQITMHFQNAFKYAETVNDEVLDKVHPEIREHWRSEMEEGIRLRLINFQEGDLQAEIRGSELLDRFGGWWNANKRDIKVPK
jgi:hypothetical protein